MNGQPHFHLFGIPVRVEWMFFLIPLMSLTNGDVVAAVTWTSLVFVGVMAHELGHALVMRRFGFAPAITLHALGGWTHWPQGAQPTARQNFFVTLAGPGVGLALGGVALALRTLWVEPPLPVLNALQDAVWVNIGWSLINLLPILPWDGGVVLDSGLEWASGKRRHFIVGAASLLGGAAMLLVAVKLRSLMLGYFGLMGVLNGFPRLKLPDGAQPLRVDTTARKQGDWWERLHAGENLEEELRFQVMTAPDPTTRAKFLELLAWWYLRQRKYFDAKQAVKQMGAIPASVSLQARLAAASNDPEGVIALLSGTHADADLPLLISALLMRDRFADVVDLGKRFPAIADVASTRLFEARAYDASLELCTLQRERTGVGRYAYNEACCLCRLGRLDDAVTALQKAKVLGCPELGSIDTDEDLAPIKERPEVRALIR